MIKSVVLDLFVVFSAWFAASPANAEAPYGLNVPVLVQDISGQPIAGIKVHGGVAPWEDPFDDGVTDASGQCRLLLQMSGNGVTPLSADVQIEATDATGHFFAGAQFAKGYKAASPRLVITLLRNPDPKPVVAPKPNRAPVAVTAPESDWRTLLGSLATGNAPPQDVAKELALKIVDGLNKANEKHKGSK
jgi:hypothetical protein